MKKNNVLIILLVIIILLAVSLIIFKNVASKEKESNEDKESNVINDIEVSNILLSNMNYSYDGKYTYLNFSADNRNDYDIKFNRYVIGIYDNNKLINIYSFDNSNVLEKHKGYFMGVTFDMEYKSIYELKFEFPELEVINE